MADWSPDYEYETIKVYFNGKEYNMKDKKDRKKLKEIQYEEKYKTKMAKLMKKYGLRDINEWVCDHHLKVPVEAPLSLAYSEIKDRKGKVVEGSFVKDE